MADFAAEMRRILEEYGDEVEKEMASVVQGVAKAATNKVRSGSPKRNGGYASGWKSKVDKGRLKVEAVVYNTNKPGLTHLLEKGHALYIPGKGGRYIAAGRVAGKAHIGPAQDWADTEIIKRLEAKLR